MKEYRENPDGEANTRMTKENERAVFAAKMQLAPEITVKEGDRCVILRNTRTGTTFHLPCEACEEYELARLIHDNSEARMVD